MCFALPYRIESINNKSAYDKSGKRVRLDLVGKCGVGDYLLVQADMAVEKISKERAQTLDQAMALNQLV